jgi:glycerol-3-phosphate acyltransferase PlsY
MNTATMNMILFAMGAYLIGSVSFAIMVRKIPARPMCSEPAINWRLC